MAFRRFGGITYSTRNNYVHSEYTNNSNMNISTRTGQPNSKELFRSHIDLSGNSILNVGCIYFENGTVLCSAPPTPITNVNESISESVNSTNSQFKPLMTEYNDPVINTLVTDYLKANIENTKQTEETLITTIHQVIADQLQPYITHILNEKKSHQSNDVHYRGKGEITDNNSTCINIPFSEDFNVDDFHMQITPIYNEETRKIVVCNVLKISTNLFEVFGENCSFYWHAIGKKI
jgi:hypothetical protein